jgi:hypothetical protein
MLSVGFNRNKINPIPDLIDLTTNEANLYNIQFKFFEIPEKMFLLFSIIFLFSISSKTGSPATTIETYPNFREYISHNSKSNILQLKKK